MTSKRSLILIFLLFLPHTVFAATRYVVKKGDSLCGLSKKFNVAVNDLEKANRLDGNNLNVGDGVLVPTSTGANNKAASVSQGEYVVSNGDTLSEIGQELGVSADSIESANNLNSKTLRIGQKLVIPSSSKSGYIDVRNETNTITHEKKPEELGSKLSSASIQYTVRE
ncbi:MAG: LysM peptidoglycan-binding domain-containing protein, partial [Thermodesulfobacteriota bacterium]